MRISLSIALILAAPGAAAQGKIHSDPAKPRPNVRRMQAVLGYP